MAKRKPKAVRVINSGYNRSKGVVKMVYGDIKKTYNKTLNKKARGVVNKVINKGLSAVGL